VTSSSPEQSFLQSSLSKPLDASPSMYFSVNKKSKKTQNANKNKHKHYKTVRDYLKINSRCEKYPTEIEKGTRRDEKKAEQNCKMKLNDKISSIYFHRQTTEPKKDEV
jgi:hypothetical protein